MNLHEYQAKTLFRRHGIAVPEGVVASSADQALEQAGPWCAADCVVKAQIHAGGRGKAGGVQRISGTTELRDAVDAMLGTHLVTAQTDSVGQPVDKVLVEKPVDIARELYLSVVVDRSAEAIMFVACAAGGMDIEEVARQQPESIHTVHVDLVTGLQPFQSRQLGFKLGLGGNLRELHQLMAAVYALFLDHDL